MNQQRTSITITLPATLAPPMNESLITHLQAIAAEHRGVTIHHTLSAGPEVQREIDRILARAESLKDEQGQTTILADELVKDLEELDKRVGPGIVPGRCVSFYGGSDHDEVNEVTFVATVVEAQRVHVVRVPHTYLNNHQVPEVDGDNWCLLSMVRYQTDYKDQRREIARIITEARRWEGIYGAEGEAARRQLLHDVEALDQHVGPGVQVGRMVRFLAEQEPGGGEHVYIIVSMVPSYASRPGTVKLVFIPQEETLPPETEFDGQGWCAQRLVEYQILQRDKQ